MSTSKLTTYFLLLALSSLCQPGEIFVAAEGQKLQLNVYHESRCPDSRRFVLNQLIPTYKQLGDDYVQLTLVPFGHATIMSPDKMVCQHGASECDGNRLMACVQAHAKGNTNQLLETIGCLFKNLQMAKECLATHMPEADFERIQECRTSEESFKMMQCFETMTGKVAYVPKLTLNGEYSAELQDNLENNLLATLCGKIEGAQPEACQQSAAQQ